MGLVKARIEKAFRKYPEGKVECDVFTTERISPSGEETYTDLRVLFYKDGDPIRSLTDSEYEGKVILLSVPNPTKEEKEYVFSVTSSYRNTSADWHWWYYRSFEGMED